MTAATSLALGLSALSMAAPASASPSAASTTSWTGAAPDSFVSCGSTSYACPAVLSNADSWTPDIQPVKLYLANGRAAPFVTYIRWHAYAHAGGRATGILHASTGGTYRTYKVTITVSAPRLHAAHEYYFSLMHWADPAPSGSAPHAWHVDTADGMWAA